MSLYYLYTETLSKKLFGQFCYTGHENRRKILFYIWIIFVLSLSEVFCQVFLITAELAAKWYFVMKFVKEIVKELSLYYLYTIFILSLYCKNYLYIIFILSLYCKNYLYIIFILHYIIFILKSCQKHFLPILLPWAKVYALFGTNQVGDVKIMFIILTVAAKPQFGR